MNVINIFYFHNVNTCMYNSLCCNNDDFLLIFFASNNSWYIISYVLDAVPWQLVIQMNLFVRHV